MFWPLYLFFAAVALIAMYLSIVRADIIYVSGGMAFVLSVLLAIASPNIEAHTQTGEALVYGSEYLFIFWGAVSLLNIMWLVPAPFEALEAAMAGRDAGRSRDR